MFVKLAVIACSVALAAAGWHGPLAGGEPAAKYPAGVSPHACPNFPHCDNPAIAANPDAPAPVAAYNNYHGAPAYNNYNGAPAYNNYHGAPAYQAAPAYHGAYAGEHSADFTGHYAPKNAEESGQYTGDGDYRGEGIAESQGSYHHAAPAHHQAPAYHQAPVYPAHGHVAQLPAGVDAHSCPNYPYCY